MQKTLLSALAAGLALLTLLLLSTACTPTTPSSTPPDDSALLRSMAYTQRHLLALESSRLASSSKHPPAEREALLLYSHCDLVERGIVKASVKPPFCSSSQPNGHPHTQRCIGQFHHCLGGCDAINGYCDYCEVKGWNVWDLCKGLPRKLPFKRTTTRAITI